MPEKGESILIVPARPLPPCPVAPPTPASRTVLSYVLLAEVDKSRTKKWHRETYGSRPIPFTFHTPSASATTCIATNASFTCRIWPRLPGVSNRSNVCCVLRMPMIGFLNAMNTIMMLNICSELPDMYIMIAVIGRFLMGPRATSHAFFTLSVSTSSGVCCFLADDAEAAAAAAAFVSFASRFYHPKGIG